MSSGSDACDGQCWYNMTIRVHPTNPDIVYRGTIRIFKTVNGGSSWSVLTNGWGGSQQVHQDTHALLVDPFNPESFYVSGDGRGAAAAVTWLTPDGLMQSELPPAPTPQGVDAAQD